MTTHYSRIVRSVVPLLAIVFAMRLCAQPYYSFSQASEAYQEVASGTPLTVVTGGWAQILGLYGQTFPVTGAPYQVGGSRQLWVNDAGFLNIDNDPQTTVFISALFSSFGGLVPIDGTSSLTCAIPGSSGAHDVIVQWKNYRRADGFIDGHLNFQIVMHQTTGVIEVRYGPKEDAGATYTEATGPNAGYYLANYDASVVYDRLWLTGTSASPVQNTDLSPTFTGLTTIPDEGTVYRFTPTWLTGIAAYASLDQDLFQLSSDPMHSAIHLHFAPGTSGGYILVTDAQGRIVANTQRNADDQTITTGALATSVYLVQYRTDRGQRQVERVAVE